MSKGAFSLTKDWNAKPGWGGLKKAFFTFTLSDNYATAGYDLDLDSAHVGTVRFVYLPPSVSGYVPVYNYTTGILHYYYGNNDGGADGPLIEVADNTNIGALACKMAVEGTGV